jgi:predicted secreted hydrolase
MRFVTIAALLLLLIGHVRAEEKPVLPVYPEMRPDIAMHFPADHGAHPDFRTEWWYITGWLDTADGRAQGFQVTFFRTRPAIDENNPSAFAAKEVLFAHAALSDPAAGHLLHDQRVARAGFGLAQASITDMDVVLDDWTLKRDGNNRIHTKVGGKDFTLDLNFTPTQPILLQGENGYSRKGPSPTEASYYYSLPHLTVSGQVERGGKSVAVTGTAWLDREWSTSYLDPHAVGWDWVGFNLDDGAALMAFQIRDAKGGALWAGGSYRDAKGALTRFAPDDVRFTTERTWHSPRTGTDYPVERVLGVRLPAGVRQWRITPLFDDQELDSRAAGGPVYWEGAARVPGGRGYLELTGYFKPLKM